MILVTGGAGFIGSCLTAALDGRGRQDVAICDRLGSGDKWRNLSKRRNVREIVPPERLFDWLKYRSLDAVCHLGAITDTAATDADDVIAQNLALSLRLLEWCAHQVPVKTPFVYASSAATYGAGPFDDRAPLMTLVPLSLYGWSKHLFDLEIERRIEKRQTPRVCAGLKFFNVFGPNEYHKGAMASVPTRVALEKMESARVHPIFDKIDGVEPSRDFVCVDDAVRMILWCLNGVQPGIYNAGTGDATTFADMVSAVGCSTSLRVQISPRLRLQYQVETRAELTKIRRAGCEIAFEAAVAAAARYRRDYYEQMDKYL